jgi:hypothetical protein
LLFLLFKLKHKGAQGFHTGRGRQGFSLSGEIKGQESVLDRNGQARKWISVNNPL